MNIITILLLIASGFFTIIGVIPYIFNVINGNTKPKVVTWIVWGLLTGISCIASLTDGQYFTTILLAVSSISSLSVALFGWKKGNKKIHYTDIICFIGSLIGVVLWRTFNSPSIAILALIVTDFIGGIPTLIHCWKKPYEETWSTFFTGALGSLCTLLILKNWQITSFAFPLFIVIMGTIFTLTILLRRLYVKKKR